MNILTNEKLYNEAVDKAIKDGFIHENNNGMTLTTKGKTKFISEATKIVNIALKTSKLMATSQDDFKYCLDSFIELHLLDHNNHYVNAFLDVLYNDEDIIFTMVTGYEEGVGLE